MTTPSRACLTLSTLALLSRVPAAPLEAQETAVLLRAVGDLDHPALVGVADVAERDGAFAVLTEPDPAVHIFDGRAYEAFGRSGGGPSELESPADLSWTEGALVVLDENQRKLVAFAPDGAALGSRSLDGTWARRVYIADDTILGTFVPMTDARAVIRLRGEERDTVLAFSARGQGIRLEAPGAPSLTVKPPYTPQVQWTVLNDGLVAAWDPGGAVTLLRPGGAVAGRIALPEARRPVSDADREHWLSDAIPSEFMGRRGIFDPLRDVARERVEFPEALPAVLELLGDPSGGLWVRRTTAATGQVWELVARSGASLGSLRLPPGRTVLHAGAGGLYAAWTDDLGVEQVEVYTRPEWAPPAAG